MPVWHALTKDLREAGELEVIGVVQEQHPDRADLYADWQGLDFPILWDPFNVMGIDVVLIASFIDANGIVRATGLSARDGDALRKLLDQEWPALDPELESPDPWMDQVTGMTRMLHRPGSVDAARAEISRTLWSKPKDARRDVHLDRLVEALEARFPAQDVAPADYFRAGVARRLRFDSPGAKPGDLQASIDHWVQALGMQPNQYIWRRRIQQWGPLPDKPYPFYDWIDGAFADLAERGTPHAPLVAPLTRTEQAGKESQKPLILRDQVHPDPQAKVQLDRDGLVQLQTASTPNTMKPGSDAQASMRVLLSLDPTGANHWSPEAEPPVLWVQAPKGWQLDSKLLRFAYPVGEAPTGPTVLDFEVTAEADPPQVETSGELKGFVLYSVCTEDGLCLFRRQNFQLSLAQRSDK